MELNSARDLVRDSALHIAPNETFDDAKVDRAIQASCNHFLRETDASTTTTSITVSQGTSTVDIPSSVTGFIQDDFIQAEIGNQRLRLVPYRSNLRRFEVSTPKGKPTRIGFRTDGLAKFDTQTDQQYTLDLTHTQRLVSFTAGTQSNPELNLPKEYEHDVLWFGAAGYLLRGSPGHPDAQAKMQTFGQIVENARSEFPKVTTGLRDAQSHP